MIQVNVILSPLAVGMSTMIFLEIHRLCVTLGRKVNQHITTAIYSNSKYNQH